jgi:anthranilate phosphoribosyltransferase
VTLVNATSLLAKVVGRQDLSAAEARSIFDALMENALEPPLVGALLAALATKGETVDEIVGAAEALRARATPVRLPDAVQAIDTCGTGGDGKPIFNVSTCVAVVAAAAGVTVAKHGNRSNARPSGSAEVLTALGVNIEADVPTVEHCLAEVGVAFLYAPRLHPAMRHAAPARRALGVRTIFNLVGPLANPAGVRRQLVGVNRPELVETMLTALRRLGAERAMVVHGREGLCDVSVCGPTLVGLRDGRQASFEEIDPAIGGERAWPLAELSVGSPAESAQLIRRVLAGEPGAARRIVLLNSAAALIVAGEAADWEDGVRKAAAVIDAGAALRKLDDWIAASQGR